MSNKLPFLLPSVMLIINLTLNAQSSTDAKQQIIDKYVTQGAWKCCNMFSQGWQKKLDEGLAVDSTIAYLWQQKAMPLFKQMKYQEGMRFLDKAVKFDSVKWLDYRAFMKCIFVKDYYSAINDFERSERIRPHGVVMDHSYHVYVAICYLQLNLFNKAESLLKAEIDREVKKSGEHWVHFLHLFYYGIAKYEQGKYQESIAEFDRAIKLYPEFSDAQYYKAMALEKTGDREKGIAVFNKAKSNFEKGYTITEDNVIYERYPYQVNWKLVNLH